MISEEELRLEASCGVWWEAFMLEEEGGARKDELLMSGKFKPTPATSAEPEMVTGLCYNYSWRDYLFFGAFATWFVTISAMKQIIRCLPSWSTLSSALTDMAVIEPTLTPIRVYVQKPRSSFVTTNLSPSAPDYEIRSYVSRFFFLQTKSTVSPSLTSG